LRLPCPCAGDDSRGARLAWWPPQAEGPAVTDRAVDAMLDLILDELAGRVIDAALAGDEAEAERVFKRLAVITERVRYNAS
jgi:hypothetical protein